MLTRREVVVGGGAGIAMLDLALLPVAAGAAAPASAPLSLFLADSACGAEIADAMRRYEIRVVKFTRDIGGPWMEHLEPLWRQSPRPIAGVTFGGAFFCLEELARTFGMVCTYRLPPALAAGQRLNDGSAAVIAQALVRAAGRANPPHMIEKAPGEAPGRPLAWLLQPASKMAARTPDRARRAHDFPS